jgi:hypothetical protein
VEKNAPVTDGTYIGFLILTIIGAVLAWTLVDTKKVIRDDGSRIILMKNPTWQTELYGLYSTFKTDTYILVLFPMFFASNWFYTYHFNDVNGAKFSTRTKALNNTLYYIMQIVGAFIFGYALDNDRIRRTIRARIAWVALMILTFAIWGGGYAFQKGYNRAETSDKNYTGLLDFKRTPRAYIGPMFLYMFYGFYDAAFQTCVYWYMGALTNNSRKLANFAGFYKGIQSAGAAIMWSLDGVYNVPFMTMFALCWSILAASLVIGLPVILWKIRDHVPLEEDLQFTDESFADVAATAEIEHRRTSVTKGDVVDESSSKVQYT